MLFPLLHRLAVQQTEQQIELKKVLQPVSIGRLCKRHFLFVVKGQIKVVEPEKASLFIHEYVSSSKIANPLFPTMQP